MARGSGLYPLRSGQELLGRPIRPSSTKFPRGVGALSESNVAEGYDRHVRSVGRVKDNSDNAARGGVTKRVSWIVGE